MKIYRRFIDMIAYNLCRVQEREEMPISQVKPLSVSGESQVKPTF